MVFFAYYSLVELFITSCKCVGSLLLVFNRFCNVLQNNNTQSRLTLLGNEKEQDS